MVQCAYNRMLDAICLVKCVLFSTQSASYNVYCTVHLCFNITEKGKMIVPDCDNRILDDTRKYVKTTVSNENSMKI